MRKAAVLLLVGLSPFLLGWLLSLGMTTIFAQMGAWFYIVVGLAVLTLWMVVSGTFGFKGSKRGMALTMLCINLPALVVLVLAILGSCVYGISKKPADLPQVSYGNWLRDDADLLTDETEASLRQYDQSWDSDYRAIIAVATLDTLNGWTYEKAAAELGSQWGLGGNDMLLLLVKDSDYYVALGDNVLDAMTDTYQAGLQGAVEAPYYQGDYDAAALAFFRQADVFYAQTLGRQQSGGSYSDYEDNGAWQGNDSGSVAAVVLLVVGIFVVWILLDGLRYRRYRRRPVVVGLSLIHI